MARNPHDLFLGGGKYVMGAFIFKGNAFISKGNAFIFKGHPLILQGNTFIFLKEILF